MNERFIVTQIRAFLGRIELELAQVAGVEIHQMEANNIYIPVGALSASDLEAQVILDDLYPQRGVPLEFEFHSLREVASINNRDIGSLGEEPARLSVPPTIPRRQAVPIYRLLVGMANGKSHTFNFGCLSPGVWQGSTLVEHPPPDQPVNPSDRRPDTRIDIIGANQLLLPFIDYLILGDNQGAYKLCAEEYRAAVRFEDFRARLPRYLVSRADNVYETKVHSGVDVRYPCSVVTETLYRDRRQHDEDSESGEDFGFNGFFTVAPRHQGYAILDFQLHRFRHRRRRDDGEHDWPLLI